ncbi:MAG: sister chromatid cohesion protein 1 [Chaenotheca gracillima]|nr:MAG: sister chromatid cohesion protein 1 [Chaenotheca gracillima]
MYTTKLISLLSLSALISATPTPHLPRRQTPSSGSSQAICYTGASFPDISTWADFGTLWSDALASLTNLNSQRESNDLKSAIQTYASSSGLDQRFILSIVMQESGGFVRKEPNDAGGRSKGLLQINGGHSCAYLPWDGCRTDLISQMVVDGVQGTGSWPAGAEGLSGCYTANGNQYNLAARCYNTGTVPDASDLSQAGAGTSSYVSDVGNRLMGIDPLAPGHVNCLGNGAY